MELSFPDMSPTRDMMSTRPKSRRRPQFLGTTLEELETGGVCAALYDQDDKRLLEELLTATPELRKGRA